MKLEKLTKFQEAKLEKVKNKWINFSLFGGDEINEKQAKKSIEWIYKISDLKKPKVIFLDSPLALQFAANQVWNQVGNQVGNQLGNQVENQVRNQVENQVENQVSNQVSNQVWNQVRNQGLKFFDFSWRELGNDAGWVSFYDYFTEIKILKNKNFNSYLKYMKSGVFMSIFAENYAFVCRRPKSIKRNSNSALHSDNSPAIEWRDGYKLHYLNGVSFPEELWTKVISKQMPFEEILAIKNIDQRVQAMKYGNEEEFLKNTKAELLDKSERRNELWFIPKSSGLFTIDAYFLKYTCPSTGRVYMSGIDPEIGKEKKADLAQSWKHGFTLENYLNLQIEA